MNIFEELEKNKVPYIPDEFDLALLSYYNAFGENYPLPFQAEINEIEVIKDIQSRIESGKKKPQKIHDEKYTY